MKLAVIKTGGKQYKVKVGDTIKIEKLGKKVGEKINFDQILLVSDEKNTQIGNPLVLGAKVEAKILEEKKDKKVSVIKYKNKTRYKRNLGHRQFFTKVKILNI